MSKKRKTKTNDSKRTAVTQHLLVGLILRSFVTGLVSAAVTGVTNSWIKQLVHIVGAAVLNINFEWAVATVSDLVNAEISLDCTLSHRRMLSIQPDRRGCITSVHRWTCGRYFCTCSSLEAIPAKDECVVTFGLYCYVVIFSCSICQRLVILTFIG